MKQLFAIASKMYRGVLPVRSAHYLGYVRSFPCIACGTMKRLRQAHHVGPHGMAQKSSDLDTVPACYKCHAELHRLGRVRFEMLHGLDFTQAISDLQLMYVIRYGRLPGEEERAA
jgi:hypothetical protein